MLPARRTLLAVLEFVACVAVLAPCNSGASPMMPPDPVAGDEARKLDDWEESRRKADADPQARSWGWYSFHSYLYDRLIDPRSASYMSREAATDAVRRHFTALAEACMHDRAFGDAVYALSKHRDLLDLSVPSSQAVIRRLSQRDRDELAAVATLLRKVVADQGTSTTARAAAHLLVAMTSGNDSPEDSIDPAELARIPELYPAERFTCLVSRYYLCYALGWRKRFSEAIAVAKQAVDQSEGPDFTGVETRNGLLWFARMRPEQARPGDWLWDSGIDYAMDVQLVLAEPDEGVALEAMPKLPLSKPVRDPDGVWQAPSLVTPGAESDAFGLFTLLRKSDPRFWYEMTDLSRNGMYYYGRDRSGFENSHTSDDTRGPMPVDDGPDRWFRCIVTVTFHEPSSRAAATISAAAKVLHGVSDPHEEYSGGGSSAVLSLRVPPRRYLMGKTYVLGEWPGERIKGEPPDGKVHRVPPILVLATFSAQGPKR